MLHFVSWSGSPSLIVLTHQETSCSKISKINLMLLDEPRIKGKTIGLGKMLLLCVHYGKMLLMCIQYGKMLLLLLMCYTSLVI